MKKYMLFFIIWESACCKAYCNFGNPQVKWTYSTTSGWVGSAPMIADINPSPGCEIIDIIDVSPSSTVFALRADGSLLWSNSSAIQSDVWASFNIAQFSTGYQIIGGDINGVVYSFDNTGTLLWTYQLGGPVWPTSNQYSTPVMVNLDTLNDPEILITGTNSVLYCLEQSGNCLWSHQLNSNITHFTCSPAASDINNDGRPEILIGCRDTLHCLSYDGTAVWSFHLEDTVCSGVGIADLNLDGSPEILFPTATNSSGSNHALYCLNSDGSLRWECIFPNDNVYKLLSTPAIADIDNDGKPEAVIWNGGNDELYALRENTAGNGADTVWNAEASDMTGVSAVCPFICNIDGDADKDVIWIGTDYLGIYNGIDGKHPDNNSAPFYQNTDFSSGTCMERAAVADIDNDGYVDIVGSSSSYFGGLVALSCTNWTKCRAICPTYLYHITDVNDDVTIPGKEPQHWKTHNTWLTQLTENEGVEDKEGSIRELPELEIYPNPAFGNVAEAVAVIKYALPEKTSVRLTLYDISGSLVKTLYSGTQEKGYYKIDIGNNKLARGVYFLKFEAACGEHRRTSNYKATKKLTILR